MGKAYRTIDDLYHEAASSGNDDEFIKDNRRKNVTWEPGGFINKNEESFDDFMKKIKKTDEEFKKIIEAGAERIKKLNERQKEIEESLKKMDEEREEREKKRKEFMEKSNKALEDCDQKIDLFIQLKDAFSMGKSVEKKQAIIDQLKILGVKGLEMLENYNEFDFKDIAYVPKRNIH